MIEDITPIGETLGDTRIARPRIRGSKLEFSPKFKLRPNFARLDNFASGLNSVMTNGHFKTLKT
jgi:hypothetical protein